MAVLDLRVLGDLDCIVSCHSQAPNLALVVCVTRRSRDRRMFFARRSISSVALVRRKERLPGSGIEPNAGSPAAQLAVDREMDDPNVASVDRG